MTGTKKQDTRLDKFIYLHTQKCIELLLFNNKKKKKMLETYKYS